MDDTREGNLPNPTPRYRSEVIEVSENLEAAKVVGKIMPKLVGTFHDSRDICFYLDVPLGLLGSMVSTSVKRPTNRTFYIQVVAAPENQGSKNAPKNPL